MLPHRKGSHRVALEIFRGMVKFSQLARGRRNSNCNSPGHKAHLGSGLNRNGEWGRGLPERIIALPASRSLPCTEQG
jgi:hypothetical protein